jgi:hypothetical protein
VGGKEGRRNEQMTLTHRDQRGAVVTKTWRGVRRIERSAASRRVAYSRVEDVPVEQEIIQNIARCSDLTSLCVNFSMNEGKKGSEV